jgi:hypothetical protein
VRIEKPTQKRKERKQVSKGKRKEERKEKKTTAIKEGKK